MPSMKLADIFAGLPVNIYMGGRTDSNYLALEPNEADAVRRAFRKGIDHLEMVAPRLAARFAPQEEAYVKWGGVAKAIFPEERPISYPAVAGTIGVDLIAPVNYMYNVGSAISTAASTYDFCGYYDKVTLSGVGKSWDISLVGTADSTTNATKYLAGNGTYHYRANGLDQKHQLTVIAENGILEINSQPVIQQMQITTEAASQYSPMVMSPFTEFPVEKETQIYQYQTPGMIPLWHNFGTTIAVKPGRYVTATSTIPLFGMTFFEQGMYTAMA
jgi:hypothetical protein